MLRRMQPGVPLMALHGKMKQQRRMALYYEVGGASALVTIMCVLCTLCTQISRSICNFTQKQFLQKDASVLFSTDVSARGLDFKAVDWVVQLGSFNHLIVQSFNRSIIQSFNHSIIQSFDHSIIQSFNHSIIQSFNHSIIPSFNHSIIQSFNRSIVQSFNHSIIQSFNHSIIQSFNRSIVRSFNHSIIQSFNHSIIQSFNRSIVQLFNCSTLNQSIIQSFNRSITLRLGLSIFICLCYQTLTQYSSSPFFVSDCPEDVDTYIHRAGRTARYTNGGSSLLLLAPTEKPFLAKLKVSLSTRVCPFCQSLLALFLVQKKLTLVSFVLYLALPYMNRRARFLSRR
jgi:hypothetical protein